MIPAARASLAWWYVKELWCFFKADLCWLVECFTRTNSSFTLQGHSLPTVVYDLLTWAPRYCIYSLHCLGVPSKPHLVSSQCFPLIAVVGTLKPPKTLEIRHPRTCGVGYDFINCLKTNAFKPTQQWFCAQFLMKSHLTLMWGTQKFPNSIHNSGLSWFLNSKQKELLHNFCLFWSQHKLMRSHLHKTVLFWRKMAYKVVSGSQTPSAGTQSQLRLSSCHHLHNI
jgi:hypothetical protein